LPAHIASGRGTPAARGGRLKDLILGTRLLLRMLRAGELTLLAVALGLAVASMATVALFSDRTRLALEQEANRLLGADLVLTSSRPLAAELRAEARARGLSAISTLAFRSMVSGSDNNLLAEITAVEPGYPLRGTTRIAKARSAETEVPALIPEQARYGPTSACSDSSACKWATR